MFHRSERLLLRPPWPEDWRAVHAGIADEGVVRNLSRAPWPYAHEDARTWCTLPQQRFFPRFLITLAHSGEVIGCIGINPTDGQECTAELGYWIARRYWGQGYVTEAALAVIEIARTCGIARLEAGHFVDNPASGKVLRKIGFLPNGRVEPRHSRGRGYAASCVLYRLDLVGGACLDDKAA